jgi:hypothetical protein
MSVVLLALAVLSGMPRAGAVTGRYTRTASHERQENSAKTVAQNHTFEFTFKAQTNVEDPFNTLNLDVVFTAPNGSRKTVPAFWAGHGNWTVRYASPLLGTHTFRTICTAAATGKPWPDSGLIGVNGRLVVTPNHDSNALYRHGPLVVSPDKRHLQHADGAPFFWLGDTWWMGLAQRLHFNEFQTLADDRQRKGFTVVQIVAGLYPDMPPFDPRGANENGFPWMSNYGTINSAYFDAADRRIRVLLAHGITPCIVGAWGYFMTWMTPEQLERHWRYLIARYGSMPVVWCAAGEANLPWYLAKGFPYDDRAQTTKWTEVMRYIRRTDPFHRLLTVHPTAIGAYTSRHATDDSSLLDFDMLQTPHGEADAARVSLKAVRDSYGASPKMPVIDGEAAYEMLNDSLPTRWTRAMFWICMMNGTAGHTYGANGIWQNNRPGDPHGPSPHGGDYGRISSQEAMNFPGSSQMSFGKQFFESFDWRTGVPEPGWASYSGDLGTAPSFQGASWIWYPESGKPMEDAPVGIRHFAKTFQVQGKVASATLRFTADDAATARLNAVDVGRSTDWRRGRLVTGITGLREGSNVLSFDAENVSSEVAQNPAGLISVLEIRYVDGRVARVVTDGTWTAGVDVSERKPALVETTYGGGPWGEAGLPEAEVIPPLSFGTASGVRVTYILSPTPILLHGLRPGIRYGLTRFDPISGRTTSDGLISAGNDGTARVAPPADCEEDWVVLLRPSVGKGKPTRKSFGGGLTAPLKP